MKISGALLPSFYELGFIVSDQLRAISMIDASFQFSNFRSKCIKFIFSSVFLKDFPVPLSCKSVQKAL